MSQTVQKPFQSNRGLYVLVAVFLVFAGILVAFRSKIVKQPLLRKTPSTQQKEIEYPDLSAEQFLVEIDDHPTFGEILIDNRGRTLYVYSKDSEKSSNCYAQCAVAWPPLTVAAGAVLKSPAGVQLKLSVINRADGSSQVTFQDKPLYYYSGDTDPGDVNGQGVDGEWSVVSVETPY